MIKTKNQIEEFKVDRITSILIGKLSNMLDIPHNETNYFGNEYHYMANSMSEEECLDAYNKILEKFERGELYTKELFHYYFIDDYQDIINFIGRYLTFLKNCGGYEYEE